MSTELRPTILLTTASKMRTQGLGRMDVIGGKNYAEAVVAAGGLPMFVSNLEPNLAPAYATLADGVLFTGGGDIDPEYFAAEPHPKLGQVDTVRDHFELALFQAARARGLPILGICRGIQIINVAQGGTIRQHIEAEEGFNPIQHDQKDIQGIPSHWVTLDPDSLLSKALGTERLKTNSYHHQAIREMGQGLKATGHTHDGLVEAIEGEGGPFLLGLEWHPEMCYERFPEHFTPFKLFLDAVRSTKLHR